MASDEGASAAWDAATSGSGSGSSSSEPSSTETQGGSSTGTTSTSTSTSAETAAPTAKPAGSSVSYDQFETMKRERDTYRRQAQDATQAMRSMDFIGKARAQPEPEKEQTDEEWLRSLVDAEPDERSNKVLSELESMRKQLSSYEQRQVTGHVHAESLAAIKAYPTVDPHALYLLAAHLLDRGEDVPLIQVAAHMANSIEKRHAAHLDANWEARAKAAGWTKAEVQAAVADARAVRASKVPERAESRSGTSGSPKPKSTAERMVALENSKDWPPKFN